MIVIDNPSQLNALSTLPWKRLVQRGPITLQGALEKHPKRSEWEAQLNARYRACGCDTSALFMLAGLVASTLYAGFKLAYTHEASWAWALAVVLGTAVASAVLGKLVGLVQADGRLRSTVRDVQKDWPKTETPPLASIACG